MRHTTCAGHNTTYENRIKHSKNNKNITRESFQLTSGISGLVTTNLIKTEYIDAPWMNSTRKFLRKINATIKIPEVETIKPIRENDKCIMEQCIDKFKTEELRKINTYLI